MGLLLHLLDAGVKRVVRFNPDDPDVKLAASETVDLLQHLAEDDRRNRAVKG